MKSKMFRLLLLIFIATAVFSLTGCISTKESDSGEKTAYDIWISQGNSGTETEFLDWIKAKSSEIPEPSNEGKLPYNTWTDLGNKGTEADFLTWIKTASIKAPEPTINGTNHAYNIWLSEGNKGTEAEFYIWTRTASRKTPDGEKAAYNTWIGQGNKGSETDFITWIKTSSSKISNLNKKQKEAYNTWVKQGNKGSEADFLAWIKTASTKPTNNTNTAKENNEAYETWIKQGNIGTETQFLTWIKTASTEIANLSKKQKEAYNTWIKEGNKGTESEFLNWIKIATIKMSEPNEDENVAYNTWLSEGNRGTEFEFLNWIKLATAKMSESNEDENIAYNIWIDAGNTGTEAQFLAWLRIATEKDDDGPPEEKPSIFDNVKFDSLTVVYNGTLHSITATGVPEGTEVYYSNNTAADVGTYKAFVSLNKDGESKLMTAVLTIEKADIKDVTFENITTIYDTSTKYIKVSDNVPEDVDVSYIYTADETPFDGATDVGTYNVTVVLSGKNYNSVTMDAVLTIERADIKDVTFEDSSFVYDGTTKTICVSDSVPEGVTVAYTMESALFNGVINVGNYNITAVLSGKNYNTLTLEATIEITRADISGITFDSVEFFEDGMNKNIFISGTVPDGVSVLYTLNEAPFLGIAESGEHEITATLLGDNYNTLTLKARLTIKKNMITDVTFTNSSVKYDGTFKTFTVSGNIPDGVTVTYKYRYGGTPFDGATEVGVYDVRATLTGPYHETLILDARFIIAPDLLNTVTELTIVEEGTTLVLKWDAVPSAWNYQVNVYHNDQTFIEMFNVERGFTSYDIKRALLQGSYLTDDYLFDVVAMPSSGNTSLAPSLPSEKITYSHEGVLRTPENFRFEDGAIKWDAVPKAGIYSVRLHFCDNEGNVIRQIRGDYAARDLLPSPSRTLEQIKEDFSEITTVTPGYYRFSVRAVPASPGTENSSNPMPIINRASGYTELTEPVWID